MKKILLILGMLALPKLSFAMDINDLFKEIRLNNVEKALILLEKVKNPTETTKDGNTILHLAANYFANQDFISFSKKLKEINKLKELINLQNGPLFKSTALHIRSFVQDQESILFLLDNGADARIQSRAGTTILHTIAQYSDLFDFTKIIIKLRENKQLKEIINLQDDGGTTALIRAVNNKKVTNAIILLENNADPCLIGFMQYGMIHHAADLSYGNFEILIEKLEELELLSKVIDQPTKLYSNPLIKTPVTVLSLVIKKRAEEHAKLL